MQLEKPVLSRWNVWCVNAHCASLMCPHTAQSKVTRLGGSDDFLVTTIPSTHLRRPEQESGDSHQLHAQHRLKHAAERKPHRGGRHSGVQHLSGASGGGIHRGSGVDLRHPAVRGGPVVGGPSREEKRVGRN